MALLLVSAITVVDALEWEVGEKFNVRRVVVVEEHSWRGWEFLYITLSGIGTRWMMINLNCTTIQVE